MLKDSVGTLSRTRLAELGAIRVRGADAVRFLQGQLSNDVALLSPTHPLLAGLHNPQGRVVAVLKLIWIGADDILCVLPKDLAASVAARLAKFVLRAKVKVSDASAEWDVYGLTQNGGAEGALAASIAAARRDGDDASFVARVSASPERWLEVVPTDAHAPAVRLEGVPTPDDAPGATPRTAPGSAPGSAPGATSGTTSGAALKSKASLSAARAGASTKSVHSLAESHTANHEYWYALDIAAGIPQVTSATTEQFVAQMLNLDVLSAISFTKGCYTGQEVIARAHYRGRMKRRMQRFRTVEPTQLAPADVGTLRDGRSFRVVSTAQLDDGRCEFLAVTPLTAGEQSTAGESEAIEAAPEAATAQSLAVEPLTLPYDLPH